jgi:hypothetical protein
MTSVEIARRVHLVGTIPSETTQQALRLVTESVGDRLTDWLPDGETGVRRNWIGRLVENLENHPDLELAKEGDWSDYESTPGFRVRKGHRFDTVDLDYFEHFEASWPEFQSVRTELGRPDLAFQIGIPGPIDVAFAAFGFNPLLGFRHARPFEAATVAEVEKINQIAGDEVVYQLEVPIEVEVTTRIPPPFRSPGVRWLARRVLRVVEESPASTRWGFHLCVGDMNNESFSRLKDARPAVQLANALVSQFPSGRKLEFVHMPLAHGSIPPPTDPSFYAPLRDLRLPDDTRFIAGFAHERQSLQDQQRVRGIIEEVVGHPIDVAASCGLGRRDIDAAIANLEQSRKLVD